MSLAEATREAVRGRPFLLAALRAGVLNYAAAAEHLDLDGGTEAVAAALRRFEADLPAYATERRDVRVRMERGVGRRDAGGGAGAGAGADALVAVGGAAVVPDAGAETAVLATGDVDAAALGVVLGRLAAVGVEATAAGVAGDALAVVVGRRDGATALRTVEDALSSVPVERERERSGDGGGTGERAEGAR